ncbi:hypothetical protein [Corynebacterium cystitidis]|uniref:hypothetical protein n=1 Tax=Corynebacterium cystitidis TaxID=35757 RepID=UPI00211E642F|nr:hypothetical protein [Corynebacterium cystitidis]
MFRVQPGFPVPGRAGLVVDKHLRVVNDDPARTLEPHRELVVELRNVDPVIDKATRQRIEARAENFVNHFGAVEVYRYRADS